MSPSSSAEILTHVNGTKGIYITEERAVYFPSLLQFSSRQRYIGYYVEVYDNRTNKIWYRIDGLYDTDIESPYSTRSISNLLSFFKVCPSCRIFCVPHSKEENIFYFHCYTVHVVEVLNYYTNHCTYIKFIKFTH